MELSRFFLYLSFRTSPAPTLPGGEEGEGGKEEVRSGEWNARNLSDIVSKLFLKISVYMNI